MEGVVAQYQGSPLIREATVGLMRGVTNNDIRTQVSRVTQFVKDNVTYIRDPEGAEYLVSPVRMLSSFQLYGFMMGDCDDHVILLNTMLGSIGIPTKCVGVKFGNSSEFNHVISGVQCCGSFQLIDPCAKGATQQVYNETLMV
jgi:transglutaminase-like putative cysteine protease